MEEDQPRVASRRRSRGADATARSEALQRLKALRTGGRRSESTGFQLKMENPIYDTVEEEEYDKLVAKRREEFRSFIVDDDGVLGYADDGEEEDWTKAGPNFSSEEESDGERPKKKKAEKKDPVVKKPAASCLSAAAALMGKQRLSSMFTSSVFKKNGVDKVKGLSCDSIVDDVIAEFAPDEADRERRRRVHATGRIYPPSSNVKIEKETFDSPNEIGNGDSLLGSTESSDGGVVDKLITEEASDAGKESRDEVPHEPVTTLEKCDIAKVIEDKELNVAEVKAEAQVKEEVRSLNAKITEEKDPSLSATAGWKKVISGENGNIAGAADETKSPASGEEKSDFELDSEGSLPFYIMDAHEEIYGANMGNLYLFGKVKAGSTYHSCCIIVKKMQRCVYAIPSGLLFDSHEMMKLENDVEASRITAADFRARLQNMASGIKSEVAKHLVDFNVSTFSMAPVKRKYAFERSDIPVGDNYVLKINYPFKVSWCKFEVTIDSPKDIKIAVSSKHAIEIPPVVVTAINLKTISNEKHNVNEIVSASIICCQKAKIDTPMLASEWKRPGTLSHFTVVRKLDGGIFPMGFTKEADDINSKTGSYVIGYESSERALLNRLMIELYKLDSDVLVGHNISGFDLDVLLHRAQACKVPSSMWSKIGRLKRLVMPKLTKGSTIFGSGASPGIMSCLAGRLLCDTYLCSRDLLKEVSYSLTQLAKTQLNKDRKEITPHDIPRMFQTSGSLKELIEYGETDAWLSMELMFHLSILPLTRQLTNISGNLWGKTLQGARAQRVEYLLLNAFHAKKYIVPDKFSTHSKDNKLTKRRLNNVVEEQNDDGLDIDEPQNNEQGKGKKGPAYSGGLVLEPKRGLYDKYILLLDFNSLYPSIIQEYNICFTTVKRPTDGSIPRLPSSETTGVLPELLKNLVERRRMVKKWMKSATGLKVQQLDIQQQALKLTANSMYGCLGFSNSRFYAKPLAELITSQGREILQSTVDLVQSNLNLEVIYGDTDSIMIYSGLDDIAKAKGIAGKVIQEVNKKYRCLEIDLDGLYKRMLLLKKKKYAAVKVQFKDGTPYEVIERKGLDMVRRDWSLLSKELGDFCLSQILSGGYAGHVRMSLNRYMMLLSRQVIIAPPLVQEEMRNGEVSLEKYIITKTLTKPPEAYPDAKNQPHVQVAQRLKLSGYSTGWSVGDTVPYIICREQGAELNSSSGIAQRARHPDELKKDEGRWLVDIDYYLSQQILPVVSRLCASIQGTSPERIADCLGLDSSKYRSKSGESSVYDQSTPPLFAGDDEERQASFQDCKPLTLSCPSCSSTFDCPAICGSICKSISEKSNVAEGEEPSYGIWSKLHCLKCPSEGDLGRFTPGMIANQVKRQVDGFISTYYKGLLTCDDETCKHTTRSLNLRLIGDAERGTVCPEYPRCNGRLVRKYSEADLYRQLTYFCHVLDTVRCIDKVDNTIRPQVERELARVRPMVETAASTVQRIQNRCAFGWVQMMELIII
ncbi:hypothetical protein CDL15_Pgr013488 [Punica granatum]|uniref:DNA polymerase n=1 Tax=Punica granatum TaxID=22663 RepID=A0A218W1X9_PUNGR|nr:hypothetical protein CDL15_Pgr013488 [Punica granatum]